MTEEMTQEDRVKLLKAQMNQFLNNAQKFTNKSAARRARKLSMEITRELKDYRLNSPK